MASVKKPQQGRSANPAILRVIGRDRYVEFTLDDRLPFPVVEAELRTYLARVKGRFEGGRVTLNLGNRLLNSEQVNRFRDILEDEYKLTLAGLFCGVGALQHLLAEKTLLQVDSPALAKVDVTEVTANTPKTPRLNGSETGERPVAAEGQETLLVKGTCRSGTTIHNTGNVVVAGDVNPGAEISATKDILIFGRLTGVAHAGVSGADESVIIALQIEAPQLRIGPYIKIGPPVGGVNRSPRTPEMALVKRGTIVVEPFSQGQWGSTRSSLWRRDLARFT